MEDLKLKCKCGEVTGVVSNVKPGCGNRLVCYCEDCRNFAKQFDKADNILNEFGGTEIFQIDPSRMKIYHGLENISCLRFSDKGLYRWYASCCQTPIGNTVGVNLPFVGLIHSFIESDQNIDLKIGPIIGSVYSEHATGNPSDELKAGKSKTRLLFAIMKKLFIWKILGKGSPNPFFHEDGKPIVVPSLVSRNEI